MAIDISQFLNSPQLASVKVERRGFAWRSATRAPSVGLLGILIAPLVTRLMMGPKPELGGAQTPSFDVAMLAVTADELVLVGLTSGLTLKPAGVLARIPLAEVSGCELKRTRVASPLTITFSDGRRWLLEVARLNLGAGKKFAAAFSDRSQTGQRVA